VLKVTKEMTIAKSSKTYLSFPDIIKSPVKKNRLFLVYREGDSHHPMWSKLILWISNNNGKTWRKRQQFKSTLNEDGYVWNCPRLSYIDDNLHIICDQKNGTRERVAHFTTMFFISSDEGKTFDRKQVPFPGMVPDKIIPFKDKLFCANHKIKSIDNDLIQLISWSRDNGKTWYDTNIVAHSKSAQFCEASIVNMGDYLVAYLRDNSGHKKYIHMVTSNDGINWNKPIKLSILGQRVTALKDEDEARTIVIFNKTMLLPKTIKYFSNFKVLIQNENELKNSDTAEIMLVPLDNFTGIETFEKPLRTKLP